MRRDGDLLIEHLRSAQKSVLLCAPFIKKGVLKSLFECIGTSVPVQIVTRWIPEEIAAGVSDLEVFEIAQQRGNCSISLLENLHAKLYVSDGRVLVGSANLTSRALGWTRNPNVEVLMEVGPDAEPVIRCLSALGGAIPATEQDVERLKLQAKSLPKMRLPEADDLEESVAGVWLPTSSAPERLFQAYLPELRDRLSAHVRDAADADLNALEIPPGLGREDFNARVRTSLRSMSSTKQILDAAQADLSDSAAEALIARLAPAAEMHPSIQWAIVREWITHFLGAEYEIAPQSFIMRKKS